MTKSGSTDDLVALFVAPEYVPFALPALLSRSSSPSSSEYDSSPTSSGTSSHDSARLSGLARRLVRGILEVDIKGPTNLNSSCYRQCVWSTLQYVDSKVGRKLHMLPFYDLQMTYHIDTDGENVA